MDDSKEALSILASSLLAGFVYWLVVGGEYMFLTLAGGNFPLDSIILLLPILLFSGGVGILICMPLFIVLRKYGAFYLKVVMPSAVIVSFLTIFLITNDHPSIINYFGSVLSAVSGSMLLFKLVK